MLKVTIFAALALGGFLAGFGHVNGHGMVYDPVARASRWRFDETAPIDWDDSALYCGGYEVQWFENNGKCGMCGDNYADSRPRRNELGGEFGQGIITGQYQQGGIIPVSVMITANHRGYFYFNICNFDKFGETEECYEEYDRLRFIDGSDRVLLDTPREGLYNETIVLPTDLHCEHCILQWTYNTGISWGDCGDGTGDIGCGAQENFRTCSDITIKSN